MSVSTDSANTVTSSAATLYGNVTDLGGNTSVNAGFKYGTSETAMNAKVDDAVSATGLYSIDITGLTVNTTYYFKAYTATNATDTVWGEVKNFTTEPAATFTCGTSTVKDVDNNEYNTVQIGDQCWMKENLRTSTNTAGTGNIYTPTTSGYDVNTYGRLYDWKAMMQGALYSDANPSGVQGICPAGWHVPSDAEWTQLTTYVGSQSEYQCGGRSNIIAKALASTTGWTTSIATCAVGNTPADNNATGFSAVPAGCYYASDGYSDFGGCAYFWSTTQVISNYAYNQGLYYSNASVPRSNSHVNYGFSVRCLKD